MTDKIESAYKTIGEVTKILKLKPNKKGVLPTHTIRFWEKEFKQIKPKIFNGNRRYYNKEDIMILKKINFLLKEQGMTIKGVKKILKDKYPLNLDEISNQTIRANNLKDKVKKISSIIKDLKKLK